MVPTAVVRTLNVVLLVMFHQVLQLCPLHKPLEVVSDLCPHVLITRWHNCHFLGGTFSILRHSNKTQPLSYLRLCCCDKIPCQLQVQGDRVYFVSSF